MEQHDDMQDKKLNNNSEQEEIRQKAETGSENEKSENQVQPKQSDDKPEENKPEETVSGTPDGSNSDKKTERKAKEPETTKDAVDEPADSAAKAPDDEDKKETDGASSSEQQDEEDSILDYAGFSKQELLNELKRLIQEEAVQKIKIRVDTIKNQFYKRRQAELADLKRLHIESGKDPVDFDPPKDNDETYLKELLADYKLKKQKWQEEQDKIKEQNLEKKKEIIEKIKVLANGEESLNKTFEEFRQLQQEWRTVGLVPKESMRDLWENYNMQVERFYDFIKINKELRDLDFKKNMEEKIRLCEKAEELLLEPDVLKAYKILQEYHDKWREAGPVPQNKREELWERFSAASKIINKKHQEHFRNLKEEREKNLKTKTALCEKVEAISLKEFGTAKEWHDKTDEVKEIQKFWKTIGMVPQKHNAPIYERFRAACNLFFDKKKEFFGQRLEEMENNLQLKTDICVQAEALKDNTDWNKTRDAIIKLQEKWKKIGPVPRKESDAIWKRFRTACDAFFNARDAFFEDRKKEEAENLKKKEALIEEVKHIKAGEDKNADLEKIKTLQNRWSDIGFVPRKDKNRIQKQFREALDAVYQQMNIDSKELNMMQFKSQVDMISKDKDAGQVSKEKRFIRQNLQKQDEEIRLLENNMSFFSGSTNSDLLKDVKKKINKAKKDRQILAEKLKMLDKAEKDLKKDK